MSGLARQASGAGAAALVAIVLVSIVPALAGDDIRREPVHFVRGRSQATIAARLRGDETVDYTLRARAGQTLTAHLKANHPQAYFNVLPPGSDEALFVGSTSGESFAGRLPVDGEYVIRVYLMRAAARRREAAKYTLEVAVDGAGEALPASGAGEAVSASGAGEAVQASGVEPVPARANPVDRRLELHGIEFHVTSPNSAPGNTIRIVPAGLAIDNTPIEQPVPGVVTGVEVADIDADLSPEVYVYVRSTDPSATGSLVAYSANKKKSLSAIYLGELGDVPGAAAGYAGHDEFAVLEGVLARRFSIHAPGHGSTGKPTGKTRQLQYKLAPGEASWVLKLDRMIEF